MCIAPAFLSQLMSALVAAEYAWQPQTPDRLLAFRKHPEALRPLVRWLGLGLPQFFDDLVNDGLSSTLLSTLANEKFVCAVDAPDMERHSRVLRASMAISGLGPHYIVHDHWPPNFSAEGGYVHYGPESDILAAEIRTRDLNVELFVGKAILDLGCSSGALSFAVAEQAREVLGLDVSQRSIEWAWALARCYGVADRLRFVRAEIGAASADIEARDMHWEAAIMNPPMMIPAPAIEAPHRDGGDFGIEKPFQFLDFAHRHLKIEGEVHSLFTNPIVRGRSLLFDRLGGLARYWKCVAERRIHPHFNQAAAREHKYAERGIDRVELWYLHLRKIG